ncbi:MAG: DUF4249 family protein [Bacteroidota bacterium]|nr:DUF4249 domain-containing protein [Candidatus Kapabacteria bacterium]MDW8221003.1 DUF4249 family protein [Bacteroidota bacterium]
MRTPLRASISCGLIAWCTIFIGCDASGFGDFFGSPQINDYIEDYAVQGLLIVGEPIHDIRVMRSLRIDSAFSLDKAAVRNADVRITEGSRSIRLQFDTTTFTYYSSERVKPSTTYTFEARFLKLDRTTQVTLRGRTTTPAQVQWLRPPKDTLWYPKDTIRLPSPDSLLIAWTPVQGVTDYIFSTECLDTLEYGKYLRPPTPEKNRRIERFFEKNLPRYNEPVRSGLRAATASPVIWTAFKWYGIHELRVYAPDIHWLNWFRQTNLGQNPRFNYRLGSIEGGLGVFGSASVARHRTFLYKNQP